MSEIGLRSAVGQDRISKMKRNQWVFGFLLLLALSGGAFYSYVNRVFSPSCGFELRDSLASPEGKWTAVVFTKNCGATTPYFTVAGLVDRYPVQSLDELSTFLVLKNQPEIGLVWEGDESLSILLPVARTVSQQSDSLFGVQIHYKEQLSN